MDRFDRIFELNRILQQSRHPVSRKTLENKLECSRATVKRIIEDMRIYLNAPIEYDRSLNGYYYDQQLGNIYELPGLWFNASELQALLTMDQLLSEVKPGLLDEHLKPLRQRVDSLLKLSPGQSSPKTNNIKLIRTAYRQSSDYFPIIANATAEQKSLNIRYKNFYKNETSERIVSPQQMTYYRANWYLDAWCHKRMGLRRFSVDAIVEVKDASAKFKLIDDDTLQTHFSSHYGIFSDTGTQKIATLLFSPKAASWVSRECWHKNQHGKFLDNGYYQLTLPYSHSSELVADLLRLGDEVEILSPPSLREEISNKLKSALILYS